MHEETQAVPWSTSLGDEQERHEVRLLHAWHGDWQFRQTWPLRNWFAGQSDAQRLSAVSSEPAAQVRHCVGKLPEHVRHDESHATQLPDDMKKPVAQVEQLEPVQPLSQTHEPAALQ